MQGHVDFSISLWSRGEVSWTLSQESTPLQASYPLSRKEADRECEADAFPAQGGKSKGTVLNFFQAFG